MRGLMQNWPLLCHKVIDHAAALHPDRAVISRSVEGPVHRTTYSVIRARALKAAQRLERDGIKLGDRVATLAWNTWRHLEAWYGILGLGAVYHTVNPRLFPDQIAWIINHAEDRLVFADLTFVPLLEQLADRLPTIGARWRRDGDALVADIECEDFAAAIELVNRIAAEAERANHHPDILIYGYKRLRITLSTHAASGITAHDFALAAAIDAL